jgi:hypothetical protein
MSVMDGLFAMFTGYGTPESSIKNVPKKVMAGIAGFQHKNEWKKMRTPRPIYDCPIKEKGIDN